MLYCTLSHTSQIPVVSYTHACADTEFYVMYSQLRHTCQLLSVLQEWITPQPSRRPDPVPDFEKLETPKIRPLPGDPEQPDEEEEEEEEKKIRKEGEPEEEDNPDHTAPPE